MLASDLFIDHYKTLGVHHGSTENEIKKAFRKLAKFSHPDKATGNPLLFLSIYSSYEILTNPESKKNYDLQYQKYYFHQKREREQKDASRFIYIPSSRFRYPTNISTLLQYGLLGERLRKRRLKYFLNIDYDMELYLKKNEFKNPIVVNIPVTARAYCPECLGSNPHCKSCRGVGSYKTNSSVEVKLLGGLSPGFIIRVDLRRRKPGNLLHFKKDQLLIKLILDE